MAKISAFLKTFSEVSCVVVALSLASMTLSGCDLLRNNLKMDRSTNAEVQDYRDALASRVPAESAKPTDSPADSSIPDLQSYIASPSKDLKPMPLVSISVNQTVPLRDALFELASQAGYDLELDPRIKGSVIFTAREKPFDLVIARLADIANLRYKFEDNILRVEMDTPFQKTYKIDYLSFIRKNTSSIDNNVSVVTGGGGNSGSKFTAANTSEADFWAELNTNITQILGVPQAQGTLKSQKDPTITAAPTNPTPAPVEAVAAPDASGKTTVAPPTATLQVQPLPTTTADDATQATQPTPAGQSPDGSSFAINKQAGMVSVNATERQHKLIDAYFKELRRSVTAQVLIEAKVLEVSLTDEFAAGVNWQLLKPLIGEFSIGSGILNTATSPIPVFDPVSNPATLFNLGYSGNDLTAFAAALSRFGTVKALASPRLTVLNNQSAVLDVANNQVYFELKVDVTASTGTGIAPQTTINSTIHTVPEGVLINVQPSINLDDKTVSMAVRPTITRITSYVNDPAVAYVTTANNIAGVVSRIPVVNVQEMDSVVKVNSGQTLVMGGLMQDRAASTQQGIPVLSEIPLFGAAFRNQGDNIQKTELVVFLKATIIDGANGIDDTDKDLYKKFSGDRHPLKM